MWVTAWVLACVVLLATPAAAQVATAAEAQRALDEATKEMTGGAASHRINARRILLGPLEWSKRANDKAIEARAAALTANTHSSDNEPRLAIEWYERSRDAAAAAGDERQRVRALHNLAVQRWITGDAERALAEYRSVLPARHALDDKPGAGYTWLGIASAMYSLGDTAGALDGHRRALDIWTALGDAANQAQARNSLGLILDQIGDEAGAKREFDQALELWRKAKLPAGEGMTLNNLCLWSIGKRDYAGAGGFCERALPLLDAAGDRRGRAYVWHNLASVAAGKGDHGTAVDLYDRSMAAKREVGDRWGEAASIQAAGESLMAMGDAARGRTRIEQALELRLALGDRAGQTESLGVLARIHRDAGELDRALARAQQAVRHIETTRSSLVSPDRRASFLAGRHDYYELLVDVMARLGRHGEAIEVSERARGRQLLDRLAGTLAGVARGVDTELLARRDGLDRRLTARIERLQRLANDRPSERAAAMAEVDGLLVESRDLDERIRRASPRYAALAQPPTVTFAELRRMLDPGTVLLRLFPGRDGGHAWLVTPFGVKHARLPARAELNQRTRALFDAVTARRDAQTESAALARILLDPFRASMAGAARLLIAADGELESIPFALLAPDVEAVHIPSFSALALLRSERGRRAEAPRSIAIVADPVFSSPLAGAPPDAGDLPRLRFSRIEAEQVAAIVNRSATPDAVMAMEFDASRAWLERVKLGDFRILHFATHAVVNTSRPALSGIQLARYDRAGKSRDGFLRLQEIYGLDLRARLVVLSACRSAMGADLPGEGLRSLTRGFLYAGAAAVVATLWDVDDRATAELMRRFYDGWIRERLTPGRALRAAQAAVRADPRWKHPYFWAGVTLHGEWR